MAHRPTTPFALVIALACVATPHPSAALPPAPFRTFVGELAGDRFGSTVDASGDVNGDGYADIVVGAQWNDHDGRNAGRAYLLFGGPNGDAIPDWILDPPSPQSRALTGFAVAIPGDMNHDGHDDIAVTSPVYATAGRVFLYWGGPGLDGIPDRILQGQENGEFFGGSVAGVGDVNADGTDDIWIGAPMFRPFLTGETRAGRGYWYNGGATSDGIVDLLFEARPVDGVRELLQLGTSVAPAGDVNHDGRADVIAGQPADGVATAGRAYVYYGSDPIHRVPDRILLAPEFRFRAGTSVSSAGDFNGDGELDQVIGAPDSGLEDAFTAGRAYVFFGGPSSSVFRSPDLELKGPAGYDAFGAAVAGGVDVNGDGYADILVGAPQAEGAAGAAAGRVYVYYGGPHADAVPDLALEGPAPNASFGTALTLADVDGDGVADAIVGATPVGTLTDPGHVYVYNLVAPLPARVFAHDEHRAIPLHENGAPVCLRMEAVDGAFDPADVDLASVRLRSDEAPDVVIGAAPAKRVVASDTDGDGAGEIGFCFERADLARLFPGVRGRHEVTAALEGSLMNGRRIAGDVSLKIVRTGADRDLDASVAPNPMNPEATLAFTLARAGRVTARLFDARGRLVRTVAADRAMDAGPQRLRLDGRDDAGRALASGIYFYRLVTPGGEQRGRVVVAK